MVDDPVHDDMVREERDDLHLAAAAGAEHRVVLVDLANHFRPTLGGEAPERVFDNPERDLIEDPRLVQSALGHQKMEVGVKIDPIAECLDDGDNPRLEGRPGHGLKISKERSDCTVALKTLLIFRDKPLEIMKEHPV